MFGGNRYTNGRAEMLALERPTGGCAYCEREFAAAGMAKHLAACASRKEAVAKADRGRRKRQTHYHVHVHSPYTGHFLHLEVCGNALLDDLDHYLRHIWLECCGHMSAFVIDGTFYTPQHLAVDMPAEDEMMDVEAAKVLKRGLAARYEYDFGTTTELELKVVEEREGRATTADPVALLARNKHKPPGCAMCDGEATWICLQCQYDGDGTRALVCDAHTREHDKHDDYGVPMPIVNSPRVGVCAYGGPAEPPY